MPIMLSTDPASSVPVYSPMPTAALIIAYALLVPLIPLPLPVALLLTLPVFVVVVDRVQP